MHKFVGDGLSYANYDVGPKGLGFDSQHLHHDFHPREV